MQEETAFRSISDDIKHSACDTKDIGLVSSGKSRGNQIKRPRTAYIIFLDQMKAQYFEQCPSATYNDYQKYAGQLWKSLSHEEKEPWFRAEEQTRREFYEEMHQLQHAIAEKHDNKSNGKTACPKSAFPSFVEAMRGQILLENPNYNYNQVQKELSSTWKNMSSEEKQVWVSMEGTMEEVPAVEYADDKLRPKRKKKEMQLPRGPRSAYTLFYQCARKQLASERPDLSFREFPTVCSQLWREMDPSERALWQQDAIKDRERYDRELLELAQKQRIDSDSVMKISRKRRLGGISPVREIETSSKHKKTPAPSPAAVTSQDAWPMNDEAVSWAALHQTNQHNQAQEVEYSTPEAMFMMDGDDATLPVMSIDPSEELFSFSRSSDHSDSNLIDEHERSLRAILESYDSVHVQQSNSSTEKSMICSFLSSDGVQDDQVFGNGSV